MMASFTLATETMEELDRLDRDLLVLSFFHDERPLRGINGLADWRYNGKLSRMILEGELSGEGGERTLFSSPRRVCAPFSLLMGLGESSHFDPTEYSCYLQRMFSIANKLGAKSLATAIPGAYKRSDDIYNRLAILIKEASEGFAGEITLLIDRRHNFKDMHAKFTLLRDEMDKTHDSNRERH